MLSDVKHAVKNLKVPKTGARPEAAAPAKKNAPPGPATVPLIAWMNPPVNTRLLVAYRPDTDPSNPNNLVTVNVRSNVLFMRGMRLNASFVKTGIYDLVGPLPRWRGKW